MKFTVNLKNRSSHEIKLSWQKINTFKRALEQKFKIELVVEIDPLNEKLYLIPINEIFSFVSPISYKINQDVLNREHLYG